jgi:hypothetical protein
MRKLKTIDELRFLFHQLYLQRKDLNSFSQ